MKKGLLLSLFVFTALSLSAISVEEIYEKFYEQLHIPNLQGSFTVSLIAKNGDVREIEARAYQKMVDETQSNRLFVFEFPPTVRGTGLLLHAYSDQREDNMWIYLPAIRRVKRIALENSGGGYFMGSDFTYKDLIFVDAHEMKTELLPEQEENGYPSYVLKRTGRTAELRQEQGYGYLIDYHRKDNAFLHKREYFDTTGKLLKVYLVEEFVDLGEYIYPNKISMTNVQTNHKSILVVSEINTDEIPEHYFTTRYLQRN
jgi:hypothetical protein